MFTCNKWFDKGEGDGKIERDLYPTNNNEIENNRRTRKISSLFFNFINNI